MAARVGDRHGRVRPARPGGRRPHVEPHPLIPKTKRFSRVYRGRPELIDHIFVSHYLVTETHTTSFTTAAAAPGLPSIEHNPNARQGKPGSDHATIIATLDF